MTDTNARCGDCGTLLYAGFGTVRACPMCTSDATYDPFAAVPEFIPRALRCACTDTHHRRGSAHCPLTPADPWDPSLGGDVA